MLWSYTTPVSLTTPGDFEYYSSGQGADAFAGYEFTKPDGCGWTFGGYMMPLLDPTDNTILDTEGLGALDSTVPYSLGYHVSTTSTSTVYIRSTGIWRVFFPEPSLISDSSPDGSWPATHPLQTTPDVRYPDDWSADGGTRFSGDYVAFVDSPDGGYLFPVYAPLIALRTDLTTAPDRADFTTENNHGQASGWTVTAINNFTPDGSADSDDEVTPTYTVYRDVTVLDLTVAGLEGLNYAMICVECRSTQAVTNGGCVSCVPDVNPCDTVEIPWTRMVIFFSDSPDFQPDEIEPTPRRSTEAWVLVQPDEGADGPAGGVGANESYGVPHAALSPNGDYLLLYVPWTSLGTAEGYVDEKLPGRVTRYYGIYPRRTSALACMEADAGPARRGLGLAEDTHLTPLWETAYSGVSCFRIPLNELAFFLRDFPGDPEGFRDLLPTLIADRYIGEVLITDGLRLEGLDYPGGTYDSCTGRGLSAMRQEVDVPNQLEGVTDPQFVRCGTGLYVYWDAYHTNEGGGEYQDTLRRAPLVTPEEVSSLSGYDFADALITDVADRAYTTFYTDACSTLFDMRELLVDNVEDYDASQPDQGWATFTDILVADPDVVHLLDHRNKVAYFGGYSGTNTDGESTLSAGLLYAWSGVVICPLYVWDRPRPDRG